MKNTQHPEPAPHFYIRKVHILYIVITKKTPNKISVMIQQVVSRQCTLAGDHAFHSLSILFQIEIYEDIDMVFGKSDHHVDCTRFILLIQ